MVDRQIAPSLKPRKDLTAEFVKSIFDYDLLSGLFRWKERIDVAPQWADRWNRRYAGKIAGTLDGKGHLYVRIFRRRYYLHRLAWLIVTGDWPARDIDHRDTDGTNNRFANLRQATDAQNNFNRPKRRDNTSGYKGVTFHKGTAKWLAQIKAGRSKRYLGLFDLPEDAHVAYCEAARELHGDFAHF